MSPRKRKTPPDGRVNSGGARTGTPGTRYGNRTDLQAPKAAPNQTYGQAGQQLAAQRAVPLPAAPPPATAPQPPGQGGAAGPFATPADTPNLTDPTQRPDEPLTAGLPFGPGSGPEALGPAPMSDVEARLRALYQASPTPELRDLIRQIELGR